MNNQSSPKKFIFNEKIDSGYLSGLYEDDYVYIEEVFATTLQHFDEDFDSLKGAYTTGDVLQLKRAAHKLKPTFGFVGLMDVQEKCKEFEDKCQKTEDIGELKDDYNQIVIILAKSKELLETEFIRLKEFNANPS